MAEEKINNKLILRATLKLFAGSAILWLAYVFTAGFFSDSNNTKSSVRKFDLSSLTNNSAIYFKIDQRELLVIKTRDKHHVFWAQDPVYGCRLDYFKTFIKPICIDIKYNLAGYNSDNNQHLTSPDYEITSQNALHIY